MSGTDAAPSPAPPSLRTSLGLLASLVRPERGRVLLLAVVVCVAQAALVAGPALIAYGIDAGIPALVADNPRPALVATLGYLAVALVGGWLSAETVRLAARASQAMLLDLRSRLFRHTQLLDLEFHERYTSGRIISRQTSDTEALRELLDGGVTALAASALSMLFTAISLILLDWVSGVVLVVAMIPGFVLTRWFQLRSTVLYRRQRTAAARVIVHFVEAMTGIRALQAFRRQRTSTQTYTVEGEAYRRSIVDSIKLFGVLDAGLTLVGTLSVGAVLLVGGLRVIDGDLAVGVLAAAVLYSRRFFAPLLAIGMFYNSLQSAIAALEKLSSLLAEEPTVPEPAAPVALDRPRGQVRFEHVEFGYGHHRAVLTDLDLTVPAGQHLALVGTTGAGKSTIAKLLARFYDVRSGAVRLDGVDLRDLAGADLRRAITMVTQEAYLFSGSVAVNIGIGNPDATREQIEEAARAVGVHEVIEALPSGYDTPVDTRGARLSAGQRQLVSFARAFLADPAVLVLDEATSALDLPSEKVVQEGLARLLAGRTSVVIAHRLATVMSSDRVLVIEGGQIVEDGAPAALAQGEGRFAQLHAQWQETLA